jgi:ketosteroid isomerase-like protein
MSAEATAAVVRRFNDAFGRHDVDAVMALMTEDCVFENTFPAPDGSRHEGASQVGAYWRDFFETTPGARFETEEAFCTADGRAVVRWTFRWPGGHIRGVDVMRVRDGKISEKLAYVKG